MPEIVNDSLASGSVSTRKKIKLKDLVSICNSEVNARKDKLWEFKGTTSSCYPNKERQKANTSAPGIASRCSGIHDDGVPVQQGNVDSSVLLSCSLVPEMKTQEIVPGGNALSLLGEAACASVTHVEGPLVQESKDNMVLACAEKTLEKVSNELGSKQCLLGTGEQCSKSSNFINVDLTLSLPIAFQDVANDIHLSGNSQREVASRRNQDKLDSEGTWKYLKTKKSIDTDDKASECGSSTGPLEDTNSLRVWKAMKQNGFLSSQHHAPLPKKVYMSRPPQSKKIKRDMLKKKTELAKREQVDRFTRIAAPSGLLTGLNPGIINHVRNSKQVQSIIEALVKSEKLDNSQTQKGLPHQSSSESQEINEKQKERVVTTNLDTVGASLSDSSAALLGSDENAPPKFISKAQPKYYSDIASCLWLKNNKTIQQETTDMITRAEALVSSQSSLEVGKDELSSMLPRGLMTSENSSLLCANEISGNQENLIGLSVKAALVAHQWLELLCQDIKGRLAALRRSKKRIQTFIRTELPLVMLKESTPKHENEKCGEPSAGGRVLDNRLSDRTRWRSLFDQMDLALKQEGKQLESWLRQAKEMQAHCDRSLHGMNMKRLDSLSGNSSRSMKRDSVDDEFAVRATAASIYSTCNFAMSTKNIFCF
ncbi:unnamed protein product [Victoria cruziana]